PKGVVTHIAAGNIFLGSVGSLIQGIITKNINILKASSRDFLFPTLFMQALSEADDGNIVFPYVALTYWNRHHPKIEQIVKQISDVILLFGGEDSVKQYKTDLPAKTEILSFGPKISFGLIAGVTEDEQLRQYAHGFARDIVIWEQRACTSCQNIFIEKVAGSKKFARLLEEELEKIALSFPQQNLSTDTKAEIMKERELLTWREYNGELSVYQGQNAQHTIIVQRSANIIDSPLNRTVFINEVDQYQEILEGNLTLRKYYMSTLAVASSQKAGEITEQFIRMGVMRFVVPGGMTTGGSPEDSHDGKYILQNLVNLINYEGLPKDQFGLENIDTARKEKYLLAKINDILLISQQSEFYRELYRGIELPLQKLSDFDNIPVLEKDHIFRHSIDENLAMATSADNHCYIFASGGTTNKPTYMLYSNEEFQDSIRCFGEGFRRAGIRQSDVVANYLRPGAFYTAFLATNGGLEETGCRILSMTNILPVEETIKYLLQFKPNTIMGFPSNLLTLAHAVEESKTEIRFEKLFYAGDYLSTADACYLKDVFKARSLQSFGYAAVETGPIGYQCSCCEGTEHHIFEDWCRVDLNKDQEVLVTVFGRKLFPIIKYNLGDQAVWIKEPCGCGINSPKLRLMQRSAKSIVLPASSISALDIWAVTNRFAELSSNYQVVIDADQNGMNLINLFIETRFSRDAGNKALEDAIKKALETEINALNIYRVDNKIKEFLVQLVPCGSISTSDRTSKTKRVIDNRK
ncbi:MAG: hypothetical protein NTU44_14415, partial [Bacteroidetes bacterium]|nr:hypothetical protein [Bacteroidota bacterium]